MKIFLHFFFTRKEPCNYDLIIPARLSENLNPPYPLRHLSPKPTWTLCALLSSARTTHLILFTALNPPSVFTHHLLSSSSTDQFSRVRRVKILVTLLKFFWPINSFPHINTHVSCSYLMIDLARSTDQNNTMEEKEAAHQRRNCRSHHQRNCALPSWQTESGTLVLRIRSS